MKKIAALLLLAYSGCACAMEIGEMKVESHLGEPFRAIVRINPDSSETVDDSCVSIDPSPSGDGLFQLKSARLEVLGTENSRIVRISTAQKINEPILAIKLRLHCSDRGEIVKVFTLLLDPASTPPEVAASATPIRRPLPAQGKPAAKTVTEKGSPETFSGSLLRIKPNDTLSGIAHDFYPYSTMAQRRFMAALLRENPGLSPDHLEAGTQLRIPYIGPKKAAPSSMENGAAHEGKLPKKAAAAAVKPKAAEAKTPKAKAPVVKTPEAKPAFRLAIVSDEPKREGGPEAKPEVKSNAAEELKQTETQLITRADNQTVQMLQLEAQIKTLEVTLANLQNRVAVADKLLARAEAEKPRPSDWSAPWIWIAALLVSIGALGGAFWYFRKWKSGKQDMFPDQAIEPETAKSGLSEHLDFFESDSPRDW